MTQSLGSRHPARGLLLDERYRLEQVRHERTVSGSGHAVLWRAVDEPLERHVAVLIAGGLTSEHRHRVLDAAARASRVTDARCVRVLDVGTTRFGGAHAAWIATEWVDGPSLGALLRRSTMPPERAVELVRQLSEALAVAERDGCRHGRLHPDQVLLPAGALPRLTGLEVAAALAGLPEPTAADDVQGLGALLVAALTGTWPGGDWSGLPRPSAGHAGQGPRRRLPRAVESVAQGLLDARLSGPAAAAQALATLPSRPLDAPPPPPAPSRWVSWHRWAWRVVPPVLVAVVGLIGWQVGSGLGRVPTEARAKQPALPSAAPSGSSSLALVWSRPPTVTSFDPEGDGVENDDQAALAVDRDPTTAWDTATYRGSARFGGLKDGVGLLLDLGRPKSVKVAELALGQPGADVELRAGDNRPRQPSDLTLLDTSTNAGTSVRWTLGHPVRARYWLVWFTSLPRVSDGYRASLAEIALFG